MSSTSAKKDFCDTRDYDRTIESLQLLFLLIPDANYNLLKDMLKFLKRISLHQDKNKMSPSNLGTIFATHLMCPRKLSAESLQSNHQLYSSAATFMIEEADILFLHMFYKINMYPYTLQFMFPHIGKYKILIA